MPFRSFITYTALGALLWVPTVTLLGFFLGNFAFIRDNIDLVLVAIIAVSLIPMVVEYLNHRRLGAAGGSALGMESATRSDDVTVAEDRV